MSAMSKIPLIAEEKVDCIFHRGAKLNIENRRFLAVGICSYAFQSTSQFLRGSFREDFDKSYMRELIKDNYEQPLVLDHCGIDILMHSLLKNSAEIFFAK